MKHYIEEYAMAYSQHNKRTKSFQVKFEDLFGIIKASANKIIKEETIKLKEDIQKVWPVYTGLSRDGWRVGGHKRGWTIYNKVVNPFTGEDYISGLWLGASKQLPLGGDPIVRYGYARLLHKLKVLQFKAKTQSYTKLRRRGTSPIKLDDVL